MRDALTPLSKLLAAGLMASHLLVISLALSGSFHEWLHHDAETPDHECAATLILDGVMEAPDQKMAAIPEPILIEIGHNIVSDSSFRPTLEFAGIGERAPPSRLLS